MPTPSRQFRAGPKERVRVPIADARLRRLSQGLTTPLRTARGVDDLDLAPPVTDTERIALLETKLNELFAALREAQLMEEAP